MFMRLISSIAIILIIVLSNTVHADVDELLQKVAEAYGGTTPISEVSAYQQYGVTFSSLRGKEGNVQRAYQHPDRLRIEIEYGNDGTELRLLAGPRAWKQNKAVGEPFYSAMLLQAARMGLPATLFEHKKRLIDAGEMTGKKGEKLRAIELRFHGNNRVIAGIDPETGLIKESRGILVFNTFTMEFGTTYDDFRLQNERLFAFKEEHYAMGRKTGYTRLERIEITQQLPNELFVPDRQKYNSPEIQAMIRGSLDLYHNK